LKGYFKNIYGDDENFCTILCSERKGNELNIINSKFEDVNVKYNKPLFLLEKTSLK